MSKKISEAEKTRRKLQKKADWLNARALADVGGPGSLFASEAATFTLEDAAEHTRKTRVRMVAELHNGPTYTKCLQLLQLLNIETYAADVLDAAEFSTLRDYCRSTFPDQSSYGYSFWKNVLTGKRYGVGPYVKIEDAAVKCGFRFVQQQHLPGPAFVATMTVEEFHARWPFNWLADDQGQPVEPATAQALYDDVMAKLNNN